MQWIGVVREENGHGAGDRYPPLLASIATGLLATVASSLAGCGIGGVRCPAATGPVTTVSYAPDGPIRNCFIYNDFDAEIVTVANATANVSVEIAESLAGFLNIQHDLALGGRLYVQFDLPVPTGYDGCVTGAKVKITVPEPLGNLASFSAGAVTADRVTETVQLPGQGETSLQTGTLSVEAVDGDDVELSVGTSKQMTIGSVQANSLTIKSESFSTAEQMTLMRVLDGEVSNDVEVRMFGLVAVELNDLQTPSAVIKVDSLTCSQCFSGSLTGMTSQNCSIIFSARQGRSISTDVTGHVDASCDWGDQVFLPDNLTITGGAVKSGSCFPGTSGMQALV